MKLILGTVQLGKKYGKFLDKKVSAKETEKILNFSIKNNILTFDTAQNYDSESILSKVANLNDVKIITKLTIKNKIKTSLDNLNINKIDYLLLHNLNDIYDKNLENEINDNIDKVGKLGVSVYTCSEALEVLKNKKYKVLQIPFNFLDTQWNNIEFLNLVEENNVEIHIRSIYLQGILINDLKYWPEKSKEIYDKITNFCKKYKLDKKQLAVKYSKSFHWINGIVFGVNNLEQLEDTYNLFKNNEGFSDTIIQELNDLFDDTPLRIKDPRLWL